MKRTAVFALACLCLMSLGGCMAQPVVGDPPGTPTAEVAATPTPEPIEDEPAPSDTPAPQRYEAGKYDVGADMVAGEYLLRVDAEGAAASFVVSRKQGDSESVICTDSFSYTTLLTVLPGQIVTLVSCSATTYDDTEPPWNPGEQSLPAGTYRVGGALAAGTYELVSTGEHGGFWEVLRDSLHLGTSVVRNDSFLGTASVELKAGEYIKLLDAELRLDR